MVTTGAISKRIRIYNLSVCMDRVDELAEKIWNYLRLEMKLEKSDAIWILGSNDLRVVEYGAKLFLEGWAPRMVFSGGIAHEKDLLNTGWSKSEAEIFADEAVRLGVDKTKVWIENRSTNSGENIKFTYELFEQKSFEPRKIILVQKPFMLRRTYATFVKQWPGEKVKTIFTSPQIGYRGWCEGGSREDLVNVMVGDLQRIREYPKLGFQIEQEIPVEVWSDYQELVKMGYTKHLIK